MVTLPSASGRYFELLGSKRHAGVALSRVNTSKHDELAMRRESGCMPQRLERAVAGVLAEMIRAVGREEDGGKRGERHRKTVRARKLGYQGTRSNWVDA